MDQSSNQSSTYGPIRRSARRTRVTSTSYERPSESNSEAPEESKESGSVFTFEDIACYIFAFAGFVDSAQRKRVDDICVNFGNQGRSNQNKCMELLRAKLAARGLIEQHLQGEDRVEATIYGEFTNRPFGLPHHAWLECNGYIFETFPNQELQAEEANHRSRFKPRSLRDITGYTVGKFKTYLTSAQADNIRTYFPHFFTHGKLS